MDLFQNNMGKYVTEVLVSVKWAGYRSYSPSCHFVATQPTVHKGKGRNFQKRAKKLQVFKIVLTHFGNNCDYTPPGT